MDNFTFGITLTVVGMAGTMVSLLILSWVISGLKKIYPLQEETSASAAKKES